MTAKFFTTRSIQRCNTTTWRCPRNEKQKLIHMTSLIKCWQQMWVIPRDYTRYLHQIWYTFQETDNNNGRMCQIFTYYENQYGVSHHIEFRKMSVSSGQTVGNNCQVAFSLHVVENVSDDCSFWLLWHYTL